LFIIAEILIFASFLWVFEEKIFVEHTRISNNIFVEFDDGFQIGF